MSEGLYAKPGSIKDFPSDKKKESIVDVYVSAESLRVYDNPWVESTSPNTPGPTGAQHTGMLIRSMNNNNTHLYSIYQIFIFNLLSDLLEQMQ